MNVPYIVEDGEKGEQRHDLFSRLLKDRIVFVPTAINAAVSNVVVAQLLFLASDNADLPIKLYIQSPGGHITAGMAIYDTMQFVPCRVETYCLGMAASMGAVLLAGGAKGYRKMLPNSRVLIHQPLGGTRGQASDIEISYNEIQRWKLVLNQILAERTGKTVEQVTKDTDRDYIMNAEEAKAYGIIDVILGQDAEEGSEGV